jgi:amino acid adenylation domain-containing protein
MSDETLDEDSPQGSGAEGIAVIGMAGRFPGAEDVAALWRSVRDGVEAITRWSREELAAAGVEAGTLDDPRYVRAGGVVPGTEMFDAPFFGFSPREAEIMDPQQRLFLEQAWTALENAGYDSESFSGSIGIFGGMGMSNYLLSNLLSHPDILAAAGPLQVRIFNDKDFLVSLTAFKLNLTGPSINVQTACSTSLVATCLACQSLLAYQCDIALAGGVTLSVPAVSGYAALESVMSPSGVCRAFDAAADGTVGGSGVGLVVLKRLADALADGDTIHAVIKGFATNNDGAFKMGYTAPGVDGQVEVIAMAQAVAGIKGDTIGYVEAHGTGTPLGDPVEVEALTEVFRSATEGVGTCALGSIKTNIGHLDTAAGVASLIKTVLALEHGTIPPSLHFTRPNPQIDFANSPFYVPTVATPWEPRNGMPRTPRRAGISSFAIGGVNAHLVLEEAPATLPGAAAPPWMLLPLSARTETALEKRTDDLAAWLRERSERPEITAEDFADSVFTLQMGRRAFRHRRVLVCRGREDALACLEGREPKRVLSGVADGAEKAAPRVAFLFPGLGNHHVGMARGLYEAEPRFREVVDECAELLVAELGVDLREVLWPEGAPEPVGLAGLPSPGDREGGAGRGAGGEGLDLRALLGRGSAPETPAEAEASRRLARTELAQPAVFVIEIALARLLMDLGVQPDAFLGFSIGEYVAACLAGVMELPDALRLVARRARLIGSLPEGAMLAVPVSEAEAREMAREGSGLSVAAVIGPALAVLAGAVPAVDAVEQRLTGQGMVCRRLQTTHAFHSRMMEPILARFRDLFQGIFQGKALRAPEIPFVSNVTGTWITDAEAQSPAYWADHLRQAVRFGDGLGTLWRDPGRTLVEAGPGQTLASWALQHPAATRETVVVPAMRHTFDRQEDSAVLLTALGRLWLAGVRFDWRALWTGRRRRVPLPAYPFERQRYWIDKRIDKKRSDAEPRSATPAPVMASAAFPTAPDAPPSLREGGVVHARPPLGVAYAEARNETERALAWMWREMLGLDRVGVHDGFFDLGGDSLLATRLVSRLNETFGIDLTLRSVFEAPSVAELAAEVARRRGAGEGRPAPAGIPRQAPGAPRPLSFAQRRLWFLDQLEPDNPFYNVSGASSLQGSLDPALAARAFTEVVRRHETLRTSFHAADGEASLTVHPAGPWTLPLVDLSLLPADAAREETLRLARAEARQPFDLRRSPLLRTTLVRIAAEEHALFTTMHHIISDGWSNNLFLREMVALYDAYSQGRPSPLPELPIQYTDFAAWQIGQLEKGILGDQLTAWRRRLDGLPPSIDLPTDRPRPAAQSFRGARIPSFLPDALTADLRRLGREVGGTLFMSLFATLATFLYRHTGQEDFAIGVPVANRNRLETEGLIGFFTNTLVVRTAPAGRITFRELLRAVRDVAQEAFENQDLPFEKLVEELQPQRDLSRSPFFQVMLVSTPLDQTKAEGFAWQRLDIDPEVGRFDLLIDLSEMGDRVAGVFEYSTDLFDLATAERMERRLQTLLAAVATAPDLALADLPLLPAGERAQVLAEWSTGFLAAGTERLAHHWVEEQAERTPEAVAVVGLDGAETTYRELTRRARQLAHHLRRLGVGPETRVALSLDRSPELLIALLGVLQAGGAYVPLDPAYPAERRTLMLADSGAAVVVTREVLLAANGLTDSTPASDPDTGLDNLAYVLYTSGSTGRPKGVAMVHRALANLMAWQTASMPGAWRTLQFTSLNFDVSFQEIFATWATGGSLVLISEEDRRDPVALLATLRERRVERLFLPFVALQQLAEAAQGETRLPASLREVVTAGEQLRVTPALAALFRRLPGARLHNHYGPTESHVLTHYTLAGDPAAWPPLPPIGRPFSGVRTVVLDRDGGAAPVGVAGELMLGGVCLARGYLDRPELTAERFVPDPFASELSNPGARLYRTGDRARWLTGGDIEFLGRLDDQVKIRGYRVEPGEIEAVLGTHPRVAEAVVGVVDRGDGDRRLVAWVIVKGEPPYGFRKFLADRLPEYEVPSAFLFVDAMPLTPSGKVDRGRLAAEARGAFDAGETAQPAEAVREWMAPRTPAEQLLAGIWAEVLRVPRIGAHDDFFALGGHSLLATRVMSRLRTASGVALPVRALFEAPTLEALAARVEQEGALDPAALTGLTDQADAADPAGQTDAATELPPVVRVSRPEPLPVSFAQERIWFLDRLLPGLPTYNLPVALELAGPFGDREAAVLAATLSEIVRRHEALRTVFPEVAGSPVQEILPPAPFALPLVDLQALPPSRRVAEAERLAALWVRGLLDLRRGPLLAAVLLRLNVGDEERHRFVLEIHHIVSDGWSIGVLVREIAALYTLFAGLPGAQALPELNLQYTDYTLWQRRWLRGAPLRRLVDAWRQRLEGAPPALELPTDRPRQGAPSFRGANSIAAFDAADLGRFNARAQAEGVTLFMLLLAAWQTLLHRASGQDGVVVGTPVAGRNRPELEPLIGIFINTLALHGDLSGDPAFRTLLERTRDMALEAFALQDLPFEKLVEELQPVRDMARTPLFQVMLVLQNAPFEPLELPGLTLTPVRVASSTSKLDLLLCLQEENGRLETFLEHDSALFDRTTADRLLGHFGVLLRAAAADPGRRLSTLPRLTGPEQAQLVREWNDTAADCSETSVPALIAQQARRDPGAVAVVFEGEVLTRGDLDARAERLARRLRALGAGPETLVAVSMQRSLELVVTLLAVWKAGAAYLPLDPAGPPERRQKVLEAARPVAVLEGEKDIKDLKGLKDTRDGLDDAGVAGEQLAYVIYTSGSTGVPKGAMGHHRGLLNRLVWGQEAYRLGPADAVLQKTPYTFDVSVWELFWPLTAGARLVLARPGGHRDPCYLAELIARERVTVAHFVPSMLRAFLDDPAFDHPESCRSLRLVIASGEALTPDLAQRCAARIGAPLFNLYGPTEASIEVTSWGYDGEAAVVPIGRPIANTRIQVADPAGELVPIGLAGELCIGGVAVGRGYLGRPDLTAERFVPDPFASVPGARLYRTGDRARWLQNSEIEFLGRLDSQVKIRGYRVEPGGIEAVLATHPQVAEAVVGAMDRGDGDRRLVAWVVVKGEPPYAFREFLAERLPDYEIPAAFFPVDALPLTPSGKVDRRRLAAEARGSLDQPAAGGEWRAPRTPAERLLAGIWSEVLRVPRVGAQDDFFALGGHSLLATRVMSRLHAAGGVALPVRALFEAPTLEALAARVEQENAAAPDNVWSEGSEGSEGSEPPPILPVPRDGALPVSFAQERLWFLDRLLSGLPAYNLPLALELAGPLGARRAAALAATLGEIVRRHEALRTVFPEVAGRPVQEILPPAPFALPLIDLQGLPLPRRAAEAERLAVLWVRGLLDLRRGPLLAAVLLRLDVGDEERHRFVLEIHHIVSDGWSIGVLVREIAALYPRFAGLPGTQALPELDLQYADYALWQRRWLRGEPLRRLVDAWRRRLEGAPPALELPTDRPRQGAPSFRGANAEASFSAADLGRFNARSQAAGVTLFMLLLAAWQTLLHRVSGQDGVVVGTPVAGRNRPELEPLIGIFINTLALHGDLSGDPTFRTLLERTRDMALEAFALQDLPFEKLVEELQPVRDTARTPLFQVMLVLQNAPYEPLELPGLTLTPVRVASSTSKFDLLLGLQEENGRLETFLEYDSALFDRTTADRLLGHFGVLLRAAAADPERRLSTLPRLTGPEQAQLVDEWNDTAAELPKTSVPALIAEQARRDPGAVAVVFEGETLTRGDLDARAGRLARRLRALGAGPETLVALSMERSLEMVVALLAVWKAGAAYLPVDPEDPEERRQKVLAAARPVAVVEGGKDIKDLKDLKDTRDGLADAVVAGEQLAYVIYTSGSTGVPKGAMGHHRGLLNRLVWGQEKYRLGPADVVLQKTPYTFDVSVWEMFWPLIAGARLVLARPGGHRDPRYLADLIARERVTVAHFVPSMLRAFLDDPAAADAERCRSLRLVIASGEALAPDLAQRFAARIGAPLHNLYGPTEASIEVTSWACEGETASVPIGRPVANARIQVVDRAGELVPIGQPGELCIGGVAVGRGYLGRPDLTAERFVPDPCGEPGARVYRSGDLARVRGDGAVEYLGRIDQQVKVRGVRIELGEIEAALTAHPAVREAVVILREEPAGPSLVAFIVSLAADPEPDPAELRAFLRRSLPEAMVPASFVFLPSLPLTSSGKTDRRALEKAGTAARVTVKEYEAPRTPLEEWLVEQCADLLGLPRVGIQNNFFDLGGHSLLGTQLIARLRDDWRVELPVQDLFAAVDLATLADRITDLELEAAASSGTLDDALAELGDLSPEDLKALLAGES